MFPQLSQCLQASGLNSDFSCEDIAFDQYIRNTQAIISQARCDLSAENQAKLINANSPREHLPHQSVKQKYPYSLLFIHGLFDSTLILSSLYNYYKKQPYLVRSFLLPGHGTRPGDLLNVQLESWIAATRYAINICKAQSDKLILVGFSLGASLAIYHALNHAPIHALILICPVLHLKSKLIYYLCRWPKLISHLPARLQWLRTCEENDYAKYSSVPLYPISQAINLYQKIHHLSQHRQIKLPQLVVLTEDDEVVSSRAAVKFFKKQPNPQNKLLIYTNKPGQQHPNITYRPSAYPEKGILNFSHVCMPVAYDHPHYGSQGDYTDLLHYQSPLGKLLPKAKQKPTYSGAINWPELLKYPMTRLHYNPDFSYLISFFDKFLGEL